MSILVVLVLLAVLALLVLLVLLAYLYAPVQELRDQLLERFAWSIVDIGLQQFSLCRVRNNIVVGYGRRDQA